MKQNPGIDNRRRLKPGHVRTSLVGVALALVTVFAMACGGSAEEDAGPASAPTAVTGTSGAAAQPAEDATPGPSGPTVGEGALAPDFELPRAGGGTVQLSDIYSRANTVVVFYRGYF